MKKKLVVAIPLVALGLVGLVGALHLPLLRPVALRAMVALGYECPVAATPEEVEAARKASARAARGTSPSPARPALGFALDRMGRADVEAWVERHDLECKSSQKDTVLRCLGVPAAALGRTGGPVDDLTFKFEPATLKLVTVSALQNQLDPATAAAGLVELKASLEAKLGAGTAHGQATAAYLAEAAMRTALVEYRFSDYLASVTATNLGARVALREHYMSALD
jgi:hypothetical protein